MKKGVVEIQFNWILVLVAGAMIFLFFFSIISWVKNSSENSNSNQISTYLDSILTSAIVTKETVNKVNIPFQELEFTCDNYKVNGGANLRNIRDNIIFSPERMEKADLITWTLSWDVPFRVTNFLFLSSSNIRYVIIGGGDLFDAIKEEFPKEFNVEFYTDDSDIENKNDKKVRFVYVNPDHDNDGSVSVDVQPPYRTKFGKMKPEDVTMLVIEDTNFLDGEYDGAVRFFSKSKGTSNEFLLRETSDYFGKAALFGSIFAGDGEYYNCNMNKGYKRLSNIAMIYHKRAENLSNHYDDIGDTVCYNQYANFASWKLDDANKVTIGGIYTQLISKNKDIQRRSCALIY